MKLSVAYRRIFVVLFILNATIGYAHSPAVTQTIIRQDDSTKKWYVMVSMDQTGIIAALQKIDPALQSAKNNDLQWKQAFISYLKHNLLLLADNKPVSLGNGYVHLGSHFEALLVLDSIPKQFNQIQIKNTILFDVFSSEINVIEFFSNGESEILNTDAALPQQIFYTNTSMANKLTVFKNFISFGFKHVLPLGLDHILFVTALFFFNSKLNTALWQASVFTLAHSVTLIAAGLGYISLSPSFVEPIISFSICLLVAENWYFKKVNFWRYATIFGFGLIHGLGFASAFLSLQLPKKFLLNSLVSFNIGVELAQVSVILGMYFLFAKWVKDKDWYNQYFVKLMQVIIFCVALFWTIERVL